jgi:site-specific DNA recombinase
VIVNDGQVEIRYVVPTGPKGETTPFCHLRLDYLNRRRSNNRSSTWP